jgi:hypothetical protein
MVWQLLDVSSWNKEEGPLRSGGDVTMNGKRTG